MCKLCQQCAQYIVIKLPLGPVFTYKSMSISVLDPVWAGANQIASIIVNIIVGFEYCTDCSIRVV